MPKFEFKIKFNKKKESPLDIKREADKLTSLESLRSKRRKK